MNNIELHDHNDDQRVSLCKCIVDYYVTVMMEIKELRIDLRLLRLCWHLTSSSQSGVWGLGKHRYHDHTTSYYCYQPLCLPPAFTILYI